jgi:hypothetical protein
MKIVAVRARARVRFGFEAAISIFNQPSLG